MTKEKFIEWFYATSPVDKNITKKERDRRRGLRSRVYAEAGTTANTIRVAVCRGSIGKDLIGRLEAAINKEKVKKSC